MPMIFPNNSDNKMDMIRHYHILIYCHIRGDFTKIEKGVVDGKSEFVIKGFHIGLQPIVMRNRKSAEIRQGGKLVHGNHENAGVVIIYKGSSTIADSHGIGFCCNAKLIKSGLISALFGFFSPAKGFSFRRLKEFFFRRLKADGLPQAADKSREGGKLRVESGEVYSEFRVESGGFNYPKEAGF